MPSLDAIGHPLVDILQRAFAALSERGDVDVVATGSTPNIEAEVQGDAWTLHAEGWPVGIAWIALDETPVSAAEQVAALDAALGAQELAALRDADHQLDGGLHIALTGSGDGLSQTLARVLGDAARATGDDTQDEDEDDQQAGEPD